LDSDNKLRTFRAFHYPSYRYFWIGQIGHSATMWMEQVVRPLLMLDLTGSALQVGLVVALRMIPQLVFGLFAGVIADRYDKRLILILSQTVTLLMHLALALLLLSGQLAIWHVYATAFISGASQAFNHPARQSLIPRIVPSELMQNAILLNATAINFMRIGGSSLAGVLLIFLDYGQIYLVNVVILIAVIWTTYKIKFVGNTAETSPDDGTKKKTTLLSEFIDGFRYISRYPVLFYLVGLGLLLYIFVFPYQQVFIPLLAVNVLDIGRSGAGWMLAFTGIGAIFGSLIVASLRQIRRRGFVLMVLLLFLCASLVLLAQSRWLLVSFFALIIAGGTNTVFMALTNTLLLEKSAMEYHGRVMSLMSLDRGLVSVGAVLAGGLAEAVGVQSGLTILAVVCIAFTVLMFLFLRPLRNIT
jgi:MFS family permease